MKVIFLGSHWSELVIRGHQILSRSSLLSKPPLRPGRRQVLQYICTEASEKFNDTFGCAQKWVKGFGQGASFSTKVKSHSQNEQKLEMELPCTLWKTHLWHCTHKKQRRHVSTEYTLGGHKIHLLLVWISTQAIPIPFWYIGNHVKF